MLCCHDGDRSGLVLLQEEDWGWFEARGDWDHD